jgi:hypothetical protein
VWRFVVGRNLLRTLAFVDRFQRDLGRKCRLATEPLLRRGTSLETIRGRINVALEHLGTPGNNERDRLDIAVVDGLETTEDLVLVEVDTALRKESNTTLGVRRLVFRQVLELVVLVFVVTDVAVTLSSKVQALGAFVPEGHADPRYAVEEGKVSTNGLCGVARVPETELAITHARETGRSNTVVLAEPYGTATLGSVMTLDFNCRLLLSHIPHAQLLVSAGGHKLRSIGAPRKRLYDILVLEGQFRLTCFNIPQLHRVVSRRGGEYVFGGGIEQDVSDFPIEM